MNSLKVIFRGLLFYKSYSTINIVGFALGLSVVALISIYVFDELSYEDSFENSSSIARVVQTKKMNDSYEDISFTPEIIPSELKEEFPQIVAATRVFLSDRRVFQVNEKSIYEEDIIYVDPDFLKIFSYELMTGNRDECLTGPGKIVLTQSLAEKYFGSENPVGKTIYLDNSEELTVSGVVQNTPANSHLQFSALESFATLEASQDWKWIKTWHTAVLSYIKLDEKADFSQIKLQGFYQKHLPEEDDASLYLQLLSDIHFGSTHIRYDYVEEKSDKSRLYLFCGLGIAVLFLAAVNFINLSTARSVMRAREVGLRKVVGADRWSLFRQFEIESIILALISLLPAILITELALPFFNELAGRTITTHIYLNPEILLLITGIAFITGLLSGLYPALFLSKMRPTVIIKGKFDSGNKKFSIRKLLVISQFTLSTILITTTLFFGEQIRYMNNQPLGFNKDYVITLPLNNRELIKNKEALQNELNLQSDITESGYSMVLPGGSTAFSHIFPDGYEGEDALIVNMNLVDPSFANLFELEIIQGLNFKADPQANRGKVLINEAALKMFGWKSIEGKTIRRYKSDKQMEVVGVVKDYHFMSLHNKIEPQILINYTSANGYLSVKVNGKNVQESIRGIEEAWQKVNPSFPFEYSFADEGIGQWYSSELRLGKLISAFTLIAIFIACLGLYGLSVYATQRRLREIGVRKVLGARVDQIISLISTEFILLVLISTLIASPISVIVIKKWLNNFTYQMGISPNAILMAAGISFLVVFITTGFQVYRAATVNPAKILRNE